MVKCPYHHDCAKYRGIGEAQKRHLGRDEPLGYLGVWMARGATCRRENHKVKVKPTLNEIRTWLAANPVQWRG